MNYLSIGPMARPGRRAGRRTWIKSIKINSINASPTEPDRIVTTNVYIMIKLVGASTPATHSIAPSLHMRPWHLSSQCLGF